jgi:hypothetical protein
MPAFSHAGYPVSPYLERVKRTLKQACRDRRPMTDQTAPDCAVCLLRSCCEPLCDSVEMAGGI